MSSTIKFRCLDNSGNDIFLVDSESGVYSTNTTESTNSSTGAVLLYGGLSINSTANAIGSTSGGALTIAGGGSVAKSLYVGLGITTSTLLATTSISSGNLYAVNINVTNIASDIITVGSLYTNVITSNNLLVTNNISSGGLYVNNSTIENLTSSYISGGTILATTFTGGDLRLSGDIVIGGTLTTVNITTTNVVDTNISTTNLAATNINNTTMTSGTILANTISCGSLSLSGDINSYILTTTLGNIGINTTNPAYKLDINGNVNIATELRVGDDLHVQRDLYVQGSINGAAASSSTFAYMTLTATDESINLSTGALVTFGGVTIQCTTDSTDLNNGGSLITPGGASIGKHLLVGMGITTSTLSSGSLSATNSTITNVVATATSIGSLSVTNTMSTNSSVGTINAIGLTATNVVATATSSGSLNVSTIVASAVTTVSLLATTSISSGSLSATNSTITNVVVTATSSGSLNVSTIVASAVTTASLLATTSISSGSLSATNVIGSVISAGTLIGTIITGANLSLSGNLIIGGTLTSLNITTTNLTGTNISTGSLNASSIVASAVTAASLLATTSISSGSLSATNSTITNVVATATSIGSLSVTNTMSTNSSVGTINVIGLTTGNINFTGTLYQNGVVYVGSQWTGSVGSALTYTSGNVGVGGISPVTALDVLGQINVTNNSYGSPIASILGGGGTRVVLSSGSVLTTPVAIGIEDNNMWFSNKDGGYKWYSNTSASMQLTDGNMIVTGDITSFGSISDRRFKTNIETINDLDALNIVTSLRSVTFDWKDDIANVDKRGSSDVGFIAQEVEELIPYAVSEFVDINSGISYKNMKHERIIPYLVSAIRNLEKRIRDMESKNVF